MPRCVAYFGTCTLTLARTHARTHTRLAQIKSVLQGTSPDTRKLYTVIEVLSSLINHKPAGAGASSSSSSSPILRFHTFAAQDPTEAERQVNKFGKAFHTFVASFLFSARSSQASVRNELREAYVSRVALSSRAPVLLVARIQ